MRILLVSMMLLALLSVVPGLADEPQVANSAPPALLAASASAAQPDEERMAAWCRALSASPRRYTAFELLRDAGASAVPVIVAGYPQATETGRHLILLLLSRQPGQASLQAALDVLVNPEDSPRCHALARIVLRQHDPEGVRDTLRERFRAARASSHAENGRERENGASDRFALRQLYRVLGDMTVGGILSVLDGHVPAAATADGEETTVADNWAVLERELWQTALLRAAIRTPIPAYRQLRALRDEHPRAVMPLLAALDRFRQAASDLRYLTDRRHRVRVQAERTLIELCATHPLLANVFLTHADYRVRTLAVDRLAERRTIGALVYAFEALDDHDRAIANKALDALTRYGPAAPELLAVLAETVPQQTRNHLHGLAEAFPPAEALAQVRQQRERLRELLVPIMHQRTLHDPAAGEVYRSWRQLQSYWQRLAALWTNWWHEHGESFRPQPYSQLVLALLDDLR